MNAVTDLPLLVVTVRIATAVDLQMAATDREFPPIAIMYSD
jgi:hypothetical protein